MKGWTALIMAANGRDKAGIRPMILKSLIDKQADVNITHKGALRASCLHKALDDKCYIITTTTIAALAPLALQAYSAAASWNLNLKSTSLQHGCLRCCLAYGSL